MKKALLLSAFALAGMASVQAQTTYPVPIERRVPWTIISGTDCSGSDEGSNGAIDLVIDRNPLTYWHNQHSGTGACDGTSDSHNHWFMIDRGIGASQNPFNMLSIQQRVQDVANADSQSFNGAIKSADIYVTDEFIGLMGGSANQDSDDDAIKAYTESVSGPTLKIEPKLYVQEAQEFSFNEVQTGRFILVVITHTVNPNGSGNENVTAYDDRYACLSEFNLFLDTPENRVTASNFDDAKYSLGENPENANKGNRRTVSLTFSDDFTEASRFSPVLQTNVNPYIPTLNWLDWEKTYFDITNLMTVSTADGHKLQITADGVGNGLYKALYVDWDGDGFDENDKVAETTGTVNLAGTLEAQIDIDDTKTHSTYRARYIVDNQHESATPSASIGTDGGIVVDFNLVVEKAVTFNVKLMYEGRQLSEVKDVKGYANIPFVLETPDFVDSDVVAVAPENDGDVEVNIRRFIGFPFASTETTDNMKWQAVQQHYFYKNYHSDDHNFTWATGENDNYMIGHEPENTNMEGFEEKYLWAFVGNIFDGFKIYNKAANDTEKCVYTDGTTVKFGVPEAGSKTNWFPYYATDRDPRNYCAFKAEGTEFINFGDISANNLSFWGDADNGSTCWFIAASAPMLEQVADYNFSYVEDGRDPAFPTSTKPVGTYIYDDEADFSDAEDIVNAASADPYDLTAAENLRQLIDKYENNVTYIGLDPNRWYRIASANTASQPSYANNYMYTGADTDMKIYAKDFQGTRKQNYHTLFKFIPVEGETDQYYIQSQEKYIGQVRSNSVSQVDDIANAGHYSLYDPNAGSAKWAFQDNTTTEFRRHIHQGARGDNESGSIPKQISGWGPAAGGSHFYVLAADDVEVNLTEEINGVGHVDFVHFPFPVTTTDDGSELYIIYAGYDNSGETSVPVVSYEKVNEVAANTPFMVLNQDKTLVSLKINTESIALMAETDEAEAKTNVMAGTIRTKNAEAGDFVIGHDENGALEFQKSADVPSVKSNYVYIPAANLGDVHSAASALPLNDPTTTDTTGISEVVEGAKGVKAVYDLQGRKLAAPAKGINIVNGKKVLVK